METVRCRTAAIRDSKVSLSFFFLSLFQRRSIYKLSGAGLSGRSKCGRSCARLQGTMQHTSNGRPSSGAHYRGIRECRECQEAVSSRWDVQCTTDGTHGNQPRPIRPGSTCDADAQPTVRVLRPFAQGVKHAASAPPACEVALWPMGPIRDAVRWLVLCP